MRKKEAAIDVHGLNENDAYCKILETLNALDSTVGKLRVVHGFKGGQILLNMTRSFNHHKIDYILAPFHNPGETIFYIKK